MAKRYSGRATVTIRLTPRDEYIANVSVGGRNVYTLVTLPPPGSRLAIDSPAAYDDVARAALSFWSDEGGPAEGTFEWGDSGPEVSRTKPRASKANGRRRGRSTRRARRNGSWKVVHATRDDVVSRHTSKASANRAKSEAMRRSPARLLVVPEYYVWAWDDEKGRAGWWAVGASDIVSSPSWMLPFKRNSPARKRRPAARRRRR